MSEQKGGCFRAFGWLTLSLGGGGVLVLALGLCRGGRSAPEPAMAFDAVPTITSLKISNLGEPKLAGVPMTVMVNHKFTVHSTAPAVGGTKEIPLLLFTDGDTRFNPFQQAVTSIYIQCSDEKRDRSWVIQR